MMNSLLSVISGTQRTEHCPKVRYQTSIISDLGWSNFDIDLASLAEMASPHNWVISFSSPHLLHNHKKSEKLPEQIMYERRGIVL
jgi:hypothetical protein